MHWLHYILYTYCTVPHTAARRVHKLTNLCKTEHCYSLQTIIVHENARGYITCCESNIKVSIHCTAEFYSWDLDRDYKNNNIHRKFKLITAEQQGHCMYSMGWISQRKEAVDTPNANGP
jgi:hypothetical protein